MLVNYLSKKGILFRNSATLPTVISLDSDNLIVTRRTAPMPATVTSYSRQTPYLVPQGDKHLVRLPTKLAKVSESESDEITLPDTLKQEQVKDPVSPDDPIAGIVIQTTTKKVKQTADKVKQTTEKVKQATEKVKQAAAVAIVTSTSKCSMVVDLMGQM